MTSQERRFETQPAEACAFLDYYELGVTSVLMHGLARLQDPGPPWPSPSRRRRSRDGGETTSAPEP